MSEKPYQGSPVNETSTESIKAWVSERRRLRERGLPISRNSAEKFEALVEVLLEALETQKNHFYALKKPDMIDEAIAKAAEIVGEKK